MNRISGYLVSLFSSDTVYQSVRTSELGFRNKPKKKNQNEQKRKGTW